MKEDDFINNKGNSTDSGEFQKKSSSGGLSKGAIAGIIIACFVLLIASTIIALLCRKIHSKSAIFQYSQTNNTSVENVSQSQ